MKYAPIVLFTHKRVDQLRKCILSLINNKDSKKSSLIIFSDGNKGELDLEAVRKVRKYLKTITGFKNITTVLRKKNFGLVKNITTGINEVFEKFSKAIFLEDDLVVSKNFLHYMNESLRIYQNNKSVVSIHGYCYPVKFKKSKNNFFFLKGADCWGWATWRRGWINYNNDADYLISELRNRKLIESFNFNNSYPYFDMLTETRRKNHSWAIKWYASAFLKNMHTLYPKKSYVKNIGFDSMATNCNSENVFKQNINSKKKSIKFIKVEDNIEARKLFENFFKSIVKKESFLKKIKRFVFR